MTFQSLSRNGAAPILAPAQPHEDAQTDDEPKAVTKKTVKVGLLLPLTGRNAELGKALQDAASVSLFDKYARLSVIQQSIKVELLPKDTGDSPEYARKAMQDVIAQGAQIVIGPVFSDATEVAAPIAAAHHIPVLSFSNNRARNASADAYLLGFSPQEQAERVVKFALQRGKRRIAVLVPRSQLGDEVLTAARSAAASAGIILTAEAQYTPQAVGLESAFVKLFPASAGDEVPFDAILLAEGGSNLNTILRALSARGVTPANVQFLGTGIWDDVTLLRRVNLDKAWFASSEPDVTAQFEERFRANYNYTPPRIASLAYDAVALTVALAVSERPFTAENLTGNGGFTGPANGIFRLRTDGSTQRGLAVIQVDGSNLKVLSPAPTVFSN